MSPPGPTPAPAPACRGAQPVCSVWYALSLPNIYQSYAILQAAPGQSDKTLGGLGEKLKGISSLTGGALGGQEVDKVDLAMEIINSRKFIREFSQKHNILIPLMAGKGWDREIEELVLDPSLYDVKNAKWVRDAAPIRLW